MFSSRDRRATSGSYLSKLQGEHDLKYPHRLNLCVNYLYASVPVNKSDYSYDVPPQEDITLEDFEMWAIERLRVLGEIESSLVRNRTYDELRSVTSLQCKKYLPLNSNSAISVDREAERRKDHVSHFVLRLAFCRS